jgi:hypothetical protein
MIATTPQQAFEHAQHAMRHGDWETFFRALDPRDVNRILKNALSIGLRRGATDEYSAICARHNVTGDELARLWTAGDTAGYQKALQKAIRRATDSTELAAALERYSRATIGGGSVASDMFLDETLRDLVVEGDHAWALRQFASGGSEPVEFARIGGDWKIQLFARARRV